MQPHSSFHRHTFSIPNPSRRFTSSSPRQSLRSTPVTKILLSALAVTAGKTIILDGQTGYGGGAGWLTLAFWAGRVVSEARNDWKQRSEGKGKEREANGIQPGRIHVAAAVLLAMQSMLFILGVNAVGPLRSALLVTLGVLLSRSASHSWLSIIKLIPLSVAGLAILLHLAQDNNALAVVPLAMLTATTTLLHGPLSKAMKERSGERRSAMTFSVVVLAGTMSSVGVLALWTVDLIPRPFPVPQASNAHFLSVLTAILSYWLPLPWPSPLASKSSFRFRTTRDHVLLFTSIFAFQTFAFRPQPTQLDALVIGPLALITFALYEPPLEPLKVEHQGWSYPAPVSTSNNWSIIQLLPPAWRPHIQTIVNTPSSSKIFYFLLLNLAYMGVQMAYGVLTNSLGLISDAIHMAFDCLGLAVGLWASVASTWKPDQQYTFGYGRVETLSGFANGCFLILISVFIIFEAIQRVMNPPELMAIDRLLWVSSVGLAINLFGMYATGGHHHHGHGHSHGHDHGHGHNHIAVNEKKVDHRHDDDHQPVIQRKKSQGFSHSVHASPPRVRKRSSQLALKPQFHDSATGQNGSDHGHSHSHIETHSHHDHSHGDLSHDHHHCDHGHAHGETNHRGHSNIEDHSHSHGHAHTHDHAHAHDHAHSHNMRGVFLHVLADTLGSVGVIVSTILIKWTGWAGFDPLASIFIAVLIVASVVPLVIDSGRILCLDVGEGKEREIREALAELSSVEGLSNYGSPRFWPRCEGELVGSIHIHLAPSSSAYDPSNPSSQLGRHTGQTIYANASRVVGRVEKLLKGKISGLSELVIQVEGSEDKAFCSCTTGR